MKIDEWLDFFKKNKQKTLFTLSDLSQLTGIKKNVLSVELNRLVNSNIIKRITNGFYENPFNPPDIEEIAMIKRYPSYLSMEYALSKEGILSQRTYTITLITTKLPITYKTKDAVLEYHQIKRKLFWGYKKQKEILIAEPEKALLDLIYIRYIKNKEFTKNDLESILSDMTLGEIDNKKFTKYSNKFPKQIRDIIKYLKVI